MKRKESTALDWEKKNYAAVVCWYLVYVQLVKTPEMGFFWIECDKGGKWREKKSKVQSWVEEILRSSSGSSVVLA